MPSPALPLLLPVSQRLTRFQEEHLGGELLPERLVWDAYVDADGRVYVLDVAVSRARALPAPTLPPAGGIQPTSASRHRMWT